MKNKSKAFSNASVLTGAAMMTALSVIIGIVCKNFLTFSVYYRITFENLPIILSGIVYGPIVGGITGLAADLVSCLCSTNPAVNPVISLGALTVGVLAGTVSHYIVKNRGNFQYGLSVAAAHLFGQVIIKSVGKMIWFGMPWYGIFIGFGFSVFIGTLEFFAIRWIMRTGIFRGVKGGANNDLR